MADKEGASSFGLLLFASFLVIASLIFVSLRFHGGKSGGTGFLGGIYASVSGSLGNIAGGHGEKELFDIDIANNDKPAIKNSGGETYSAENNAAAKAVENIYPSNNVAALQTAAGTTGDRKFYECEFGKTGPVNHKIIFSEINWSGSKDSANDEWIELKNNSGKDIELSGWKILSADGNLKINFGASEKISAGSLYLLARGNGDNTNGVAADKNYSGALSNGGEYLKMFDEECGISDEIDASKKWPAGESSSKKTMERSNLDMSWHTSANTGGTPGKENSMAFAAKEQEISFANPGGIIESPSSTGPDPSQQTQQSGSTHILIAAVQITGGSGKTENDFVKIFNPSPSPFNLKGYRLVKRTKTGTSDTSLKSWTSDTVIPAGGYYTWANSSLSGMSPVPDTVTSGSISADNGIAVRQGPEDTGNIIDAVAWGTAQNAFIEGNVYPDNPGANQALSRKSANGTLQDTDNNAGDFELK